MQKKLRLEKQLSSGAHGKSVKAAVNGKMNGEINGMNGKGDGSTVKDIENIVPDIAHDKKSLNRILDKTRCVAKDSIKRIDLFCYQLIITINSMLMLL